MWFMPDAVLEVAYGVLDLGVAAMIGLQLQRLPIAVGDEAVIAVSGEEGELGTVRRLHPPDDEPHRRVKPTPGSQLALFARYSYHGFITDRDGETLELEADHRRQIAECRERHTQTVKYGVGLNHMPSGRFAANGAWLAIQVMAHNLARWTARIGLGERTVTTKTLRRRFFSLAGRITRSARRLTLHLPQSWPWQEKFGRALARLRAIPLPAVDDLSAD